jgi:hypothetical protein
MKHKSKMRKAEPAIISGSTKLSRSARPILYREKLAKKVAKLAVEALKMYEQSWKKLSELRPLIAQLREQFMKLKPGEKIAGCPTWTAYCQKILHRTDRRIRQILEGANPASAKHSRKSLPGPKTVKVELTRDAVVANSYLYAYTQFQLAKLPEEEHNKGIEELLDKLRHEAEWTREMAVANSLYFACSQFQEAKLSEEEHKKAVEELLDRLRQEIVPGH